MPVSAAHLLRPKADRRAYIAFSAFCAAAIFLTLLPMTNHRVLAECNTFTDSLQNVIIAMRHVKMSATFLLPHVDRCVRLEELGTAAPTLAVLGLAAVSMLWSQHYWLRIVERVRIVSWADWVITAIAIMVPYCLMRFVANPDVSNPSDFGVLMRLALFAPRDKFFLPLISICALWGPATLVMLVQWDKFVQVLHLLGPGVVVLIFFMLPLAATGEPRFMTMAWPIVALTVSIIIEAADKPAVSAYVFGVLSIVSAQFWLPLNYASWTGFEGDALLRFPQQLYFMHFGLWMSPAGYALEAVLTVGIGLICWVRFRDQSGPRLLQRQP